MAKNFQTQCLLSSNSKTCYNTGFFNRQPNNRPLMKLAVIGVNHKTAPVVLRERLSFGVDMAQAIGSLRASVETFGVFYGAVIVSTCNRSELYVGLNTADDDANLYQETEHLKAWLADFKDVALNDIDPFLYSYTNERALNHWLRVSAGLDSMILGEPQILGQIKTAVALSKDADGMGKQFDWLTQQIFAAARHIRRDSKIGEQAVTLGFATAKLVTQIFDNPPDTTLLMVAAGEMNRLVAHNVANLGMKRIIIANRTPARAESLRDELRQMAGNAGRKVEIECVGLDKLDWAVSQADVVSSCSGSMNVLITKDMVKAAQKIRRHRPLLLVDLAVPRDIEPSVARLDDVYLYSVDDLQHVIAGNIAERKQAAVEAEIMVSEQTAHIETQMQLISARKMIAEYRSVAAAHKQRLLDHAKQRLVKGDDAQTVLDEFAHALTQTLTHSPSRLIRDTASYAEPMALDRAVGVLKEYRHKKGS